MPTPTPRRIEYLPVRDVRPAARNPKGHDDAAITASMARFGFTEPVLMDERTGRLIAGHGRLERLVSGEELGIDPPDGIVVKRGQWCLPVVRGWASANDAEADAYLIASNRLVERGGWNTPDLATMLAELVAGPGLDGIGYTPNDLDTMLLTLADPTPPPAEPTTHLPPAKPRTKAGDVWLLGPHRLLCGDSRNAAHVEQVMAGAPIHVAFTSPPYAEQRDYDETSGFRPIPPGEYVEWFAPVAENVAAHLADDGSWFVNIKPAGEGLDTKLYVFDLVLAHVRRWGWHFLTEFCWERIGVPKAVVLRFKNQFEPVYQFTRGRPKIRPMAVRHASSDMIVPFGPGRGNTSWADPESAVVSQGQRGDLFEGQRTRPKRVEDTNWRRRQGGGGAIPDDAAPALRKRKRGTTGRMADDQGTGSDVGAALTEGWAFPGNRLPTFAGTHEATGHTAAFPVGLPAWFVRAYSDVGDHVFDPFVGSGSTLLAAHELQRIGHGIELSPAYCDTICARWQRTTGERPVLERTGKPATFA